MQRTRARGSMQRSLEELEAEEQENVARALSGSPLSMPSASAGSAAGPAASAGRAASITTASSGRDLAATPRGALLQQLAAEATAAAAAARPRSDQRPAQPTYSAVMAKVDDALRSANASPTRLPKPAARGGYLSPGDSPPKLARGPAAGQEGNHDAHSARISAYRS